MKNHAHSNRCYFLVAVHAFFIKDGKILLLRRKNTGYMDGFYSVPAGHVDGEETIWKAMVREAFEEVAVKLDPDSELDPVHVMHRTKTNDEERIDYFYKIENWNGELENAEPEKCDHLRWFELDGLPEKIIPYVKLGIEKVKSSAVFSEFDEN